MHGLQTMAYLNGTFAADQHRRAADPGNSSIRAAEERLNEALAHLSSALAELANAEENEELASIRRARAPEWSVQRHGAEWWVLPLSAAARTNAQAIIPPGARRYGMHYILAADDLLTGPILESIAEAQNA